LKRFALRYEIDAQSDLERVVDYGIEQEHPDPASYVRALGDRIAMLREQPKAGREGRMNDTREMVIAGTPYIAIYRSDDTNGITVLRVLHGAQQWPPTSEDMQSSS